MHERLMKGIALDERTSSPSWLQALLVASDFRREVVIVSFAAAVTELLTRLRFRVEEPSGEVALAGTWLFRLLARIFAHRKKQTILEFRVCCNAILMNFSHELYFDNLNSCYSNKKFKKKRSIKNVAARSAKQKMRKIDEFPLYELFASQ